MVKKVFLSLLYFILKINLFEKIIVYFLTYPVGFFLLKIVPPNTYFKKGETLRICNRNKVNYKLDLYDYMQWSIYFYNKNDSSLNLLKYIKNDDIFFDIGGNIGQTALNVAKKIGKNGKVYCFEPFPENYDSLLFNLKLNTSINNIIPENIALGENETILEMYKSCIGNSGGNRIVSDATYKNESAIGVRVTTLDNYCKENKIEKINFIKIDVEGFELKVLNGAINTLKNLSPKLYIEIVDTNLIEQGDSAQELINFLINIGYSIFDSVTDKQIKKYVELSENCYDIYCTKNNND